MTINSKSSLMPSFLSDQDQIELIAPARAVSKTDIAPAIKIIESFGLKVKYNKNLFNKENIFSGTKKQRIEDLQLALDNKETKAIFFARGGYGSIQIIDDINFANFSKNPKWLVGFSDITTILIHLYRQYQINSIHGPMLFDFQRTTPLSIKKLFNLLKGDLNGDLNTIEADHHMLNTIGTTSGIIIGGNLSILCSLMGSRSFFNLNKDHILFLEDVDEYIYHIERMMYTLDRGGVLKKIKGLIIGNITNVMDNKQAFGKTVYQVIHEIVKKYNYPVCFNWPLGHDKENHPIIIGAHVELEVNSECSKLKYQ